MRPSSTWKCRFVSSSAEVRCDVLRGGAAVGDFGGDGTKRLIRLGEYRNNRPLRQRTMPETRGKTPSALPVYAGYLQCRSMAMRGRSTTRIFRSRRRASPPRMSRSNVDTSPRSGAL